MKILPRFPSGIHCRHIVIIIIAAVPLSPSAVDAQDSDDDVFQLPEFVVDASAERGYRATNTLTGTFLDTPLQDSPFAIDVFMPDLISDTGSTNMREVLAYDSGLQLENTIASQGPGGEGGYTLGTEFDARGIDNAETDVVTRGFRAPTLKNGFFTQTRVDTINIARVERAGGPQSLLYGIGAISGITNVITKRPLPEPRYSLETFAGSHDFYRATGEATGPLWSRDSLQLNYNTLFAVQREGTLRPDQKDETLFITPALQFRGWDATTVFLSYERGWRTQHGTGPRDISHPRAGVINPATGQPSGTRITDENARFLEDYLGLGPYMNLGGPDASTDDTVDTWHFELTQRIGQHFRILASFNRDTQDRDQRFFAVSPTLREQPAPNVEDDILYAFADDHTSRVTHQARLAALASFEFFGGRHSFVAGRQEYSERRTDQGFPASSLLLGQDFFTVWPADGSAIRYESEPLVQPIELDRFNEWYQGNYLIYQGSLWRNRIHPVLGYRWDRTQTRFLRQRYLEDRSLGEAFDPLTGRNTLDGYANAGIPFTVETPTLGLSVTIHPNVSIYGAYAEGIALSNIAQRDGNEEGFPPEFTRNREAGVKFTLWGERISGRLTYFNLQKRGGVRYSFYAPAPFRESFDPNEPVTIALLAGTTANPADLRHFMAHLGLYDFETQTFARTPLDLPGVEVVDIAGTRRFVFPWGDPSNPGSYDPATNTAPGGYGADFLAHVQSTREGADRGTTPPGIGYVWGGGTGGNYPGADRGAYHNFDESSTGYEARIQINPVDNWDILLSYTYTDVQIETGLTNLADPEVTLGIEPWFIYLPIEDFADPARPSTYQGALSAGVRNTDVPRHSFTLWTKYAFTEGFLEGFDLRFGARYSSSRAAESPWATPAGGFVNAIERGLGENTKAPIPGHTIYDAGMGYRWNWQNLDWRLNLNVRNIFDKRELTAVAANRTVFGEPVLSRFFIRPREVRVSLRLDF